MPPLPKYDQQALELACLLESLENKAHLIIDGHHLPFFAEHVLTSILENYSFTALMKYEQEADVHFMGSNLLTYALAQLTKPKVLPAVLQPSTQMMLNLWLSQAVSDSLNPSLALVIIDHDLLLLEGLSNLCTDQRLLESLSFQLKNSPFKARETMPGLFTARLEQNQEALKTIINALEGFKSISGLSNFLNCYVDTFDLSFTPKRWRLVVHHRQDLLVLSLKETTYFIKAIEGCLKKFIKPKDFQLAIRHNLFLSSHPGLRRVYKPYTQKATKKIK